MHKMGLKGMFEMHLYIIYYTLDLSDISVLVILIK